MHYTLACFNIFKLVSIPSLFFYVVMYSFLWIWLRMHTGDCGSDNDDLSTGAVVAISVVVTFIITLVVTAVVTYIITTMYYKCQPKKIVSKNNDKNISYQENNQFVLMDRDVKMDTNPSYAIMDRDTIKIDTNPAYVVTKWLCMCYNCACVTSCLYYFFTFCTVIVIFVDCGAFTYYICIIFRYEYITPSIAIGGKMIRWAFSHRYLHEDPSLEQKLKCSSAKTVTLVVSCDCSVRASQFISLLNTWIICVFHFQNNASISLNNIQD